MGKHRVELNHSEIRRLLNSSQMQGVLVEHAQRVAATAGAGFEASVQPGKNRAHARVATSTPQAAARNAHDNTLLKALGASL